MIDESEINCRQFFHLFAVDIYVKIEAEWLTYVRLNQQELQSEEYIHLRDAFNTDGDVNNVDKMRDATSYVRQ